MKSQGLNKVIRMQLMSKSTGRRLPTGIVVRSVQIEFALLRTTFRKQPYAHSLKSDTDKGFLSLLSLRHMLPDSRINGSVMTLKSVKNVLN